MFVPELLLPTARRSRDPINLSRMPSLGGLGIDYRTWTEEDEHAAGRMGPRLIRIALTGAVVAILFRFLSGFMTREVFLALSVLIGVLFGLWSTVSIFTVGLRAVIERFFVAALAGPVIWLMIVLTKTTSTHLLGYFGFFLFAVLFAAYVLDRVLQHDAAWSRADSNLADGKRESWAGLWNKRLRGGGGEDKEQTRFLAAYRRGIVFLLVVFAAGFLGMTLSKAVYPWLFAGMIGISSVLGAALLLLLLSRPLTGFGPRDLLGAFWGALRGWSAYNTHDTSAPGVFQSPGGDARRRRGLTLAATFFLTLSALPLAGYFPVGMMATGRMPWVEQASKSWVRKVPPLSSRLPAPPEAFEERTLSEVQASLQPWEQEYFSELPRNERAEWLGGKREEQRASQTEGEWSSYVDLATSRIVQSPETFLTLAATGLPSGNTPLIWSLVPAVLLSISVPPLIFILLGALFIGPAVVVQRSALTPPQRNHAETWDGYVRRLHSSRHRANGTRLRDHLWLGTNWENDYPILLDRRVLHDHAWILGDSGAGKTSRGLAPLAAQLIRLAHVRNRDPEDTAHSVVIIDLKGERSLFRGAQLEAERYGIPFKWLTIEPNDSTYAFNPFQQKFLKGTSLDQQAQILLQSLGLDHGEGYGPLHFTIAHLRVLARALGLYPDIASFSELSEKLAAQDGLPDVSEGDRDEAADLFVLTDQLSRHPAINVTTDEDPVLAKHGIDMADVINGPQVLYFYLPAVREPGTGRRVARLALYSLLATAHHLEQTTGKVGQVYCLVDEFQRMADQALSLFLQQARSKGISLVLANQNITDLRVRNEDITPTVMGNTRFWQIFASKNLDQQDILIKASGEALHALWSESESSSPTGLSSSLGYRETVFPLINRNDLIEMSDHPDRCYFHISRGSGYSQFSGYPFIGKTQFHITADEEDARKRHPWPEATEETTVLTVSRKPVGKTPKHRKKQRAKAATPEQPEVALEEDLEPDETTEYSKLDSFFEEQQAKYKRASESEKKEKTDET